VNVTYLPTLLRQVIRAGRAWHLFSDGTLLPVVSGGDGPTATLNLTYTQAKNRLKDIEDELERLEGKADKTETRSLTEEDQTYWDGLVAEAKQVGAHAQGLERASQREELKRMKVGNVVAGSVVRGSDDMDSDPLGEPDSIEARRFKNPWDTGEIRMGLSPAARGAELRSRALSAIEKMQGTTDKRRSVATDMVEQWDTEGGALSQQVLATSSPEYLSGFMKLARSNGRSEALNTEERQAVERAMSLTDSAGGYLVPFQLDPTVILTSDGSYNEIRKIARTVVATGDVWNGVSAGAVSWSFDAEAAEVSDDTPTFAQPAITIRTARGFVPISLEAYQDAANVTTEVGRLLAQGKDDLEATKFITGAAGSNEPIGIITALTGTSSVVTSTTTDTFAIGDLYKVYNALPARYRARSAWLANNLVYSLSRQFDTGGGAGLWARLGDDRPAQLIGKPVYEAEAMDGTITALADNLIAIIGDFSNYVIADRVGMTVEFIPNLFGANFRPTGQKGWFAHYRVGADSVNDGAFRVLNVT
jgi:HK97 family phage major capsid protein